MKKTTKKGGKGTKMNGTKCKTPTKTKITVNKVRSTSNTKRLASNGLALPKYIYMHSKNPSKPSYRVLITHNSNQRYVGTFRTISAAVKALNNFKRVNRIK